MIEEEPELSEQEFNSLPFVSTDFFFRFAVAGIGGIPVMKEVPGRQGFSSLNYPLLDKEVRQYVREVDVSKIVSSPAPVSGWQEILNASGTAYLDQILKDVRNGWFKQSPQVLYEFGEVYIVAGLGRRVAAAKKVNSRTIPALTYPLRVIKAAAYSQKDMEVLQERMDLGLWGGIREIDSLKCYALWKVSSYQAPWVFAEDMDRVRDIYQKIFSTYPDRQFLSIINENPAL